MTERDAAERRRLALALSLLEGVGPVRYRGLCAEHGSGAEAFRRTARGARREAALRSADAALAAAERAGATPLLPGDADYPAALLDLPDPPPRLFALGDARAARRPAVAVVGTRGATPYGARTAAALADALARAGACVVSGLARGIDAAAHRAALDAGGRTVAVLGTGVDVPYPRAHHALHAEIASAGAVLSEELPGAGAAPGSFPRRNRIIAALADLTIVVEAPPKSGALITAGVALDLGRQVAAIPGPIDQRASRGSNDLLRDGAAVLTSVDDALALLALPAVSRADVAPPPSLGPSADRVLEALADGPLDPDRLVVETGLAAGDCLSAVTALELAGRLTVGAAGELRRV